jgi:CheY-like chemotaxis protein/DNA-binding MarR family transcriptional regulator
MKTEQQLAQAGRPHILVVEDDLALSEELVEYLRLNDLLVSTCASATAAMELIEGDPTIRVIATDIGLGALSGLELLRKVSQSRRHAGIQTIVFSGNTSVDTLLIALRLGAVDYLPKPIDGEELLNAINRALTRSAGQATRRRRELSTAKLLMEVRKRRDALFGAELFEDPAWNILLDLHESTLRGISLSVTDLCTGAGTSSTTALRRLNSLISLGLAERVPDSTDGRRVFIRQTRLGAEKMQSFNQWFHSLLYADEQD